LDHYLLVAADRYQRPPVVLPSPVRSLLTGYAWPGNIRELSAWVERLYVTGLSPEVLLDMLMGESSNGQISPNGQMTLKQAERQVIVQAMESANFNQRKAARMLQVHRATLARKLRSHKLD
jgi:two-component system C4-dicarboxylate transport response regulator DctD